MPELPEVETVKRGLCEHALNKCITKVTVRQASLRWPVDKDMPQFVENQVIRAITRRAKYIIIALDRGFLLVHLGMSGAVYFQKSSVELKKHDHIIMQLGDGVELRYHDPRRFGSWHWIKEDVEKHKLLKDLGPEPLANDFHAQYLWERTRSRKASIKNIIMDQKVVVGVGNIYAAEALFIARIHPLRAGDKVKKADCERLVKAIKHCLQAAIEQGGTTLRDFVNADSKPGYFKQKLFVYAKEGRPCQVCNTVIESCRIGQRASAYCPNCQIK